jgi:hypothetical protein
MGSWMMCVRGKCDLDYVIENDERGWSEEFIAGKENMYRGLAGKFEGKT